MCWQYSSAAVNLTVHTLDKTPFQRLLATLITVHPKPRAQRRKPISRACRSRSRRLDLMCQLLQQLRPAQRIHPAVFLIPHLDVVELICVGCAHELDCLLQLHEVVLQGDVVEAADVIGEEVDVDGELLDTVGVDAADGGGKRESKDGFGRVADRVEEHEFFDLGRQREENG
jgi:hypothetical protein